MKHASQRGYNDVSEWLADPNHLYIGRRMNISIYTKHKSKEPPGTEVAIDESNQKTLIRPYSLGTQPFDQRLLSYPVGSYVDDYGKIVHLCTIPQSKWHNPFKVQKTADGRKICINRFEPYFVGNKYLQQSLSELDRYTEIGCWCKPLSCHGDTILSYYHRQKIRNKSQQNVRQKMSINETESKMTEKNFEMNQSNCNQQHRNLQSRAPKGKLSPSMTIGRQLSAEIRNSTSVRSALCIIPPKPLCGAIQQIRKQHDPGFYRWFPHINICYPFAEDQHFQQIANYMFNAVVKKNKIKSFNVRLNGFEIFDRVKVATNAYLKYDTADGPHGWNGSNVEYLYLKPQGCQIELQRLFGHLKKEFPASATAHGGKFVPHLTVGQFKAKEIIKYKASLQNSWSPIAFKVKEIYLISRRQNEPFKIRFKIPLCE